MWTTCGLNISKNPPEAAKVAKLFNLEKTYACSPHQDFEMQFFSTLFKTFVYRRVSFSAVEIILSKEQEIFGPKILMMETTISIYPTQKLELLSPQNRYIGHQCGI